MYSTMQKPEIINAKKGNTIVLFTHLIRKLKSKVKIILIVPIVEEVLLDK